MKQAIFRWVIYFAAILIVGPLAAALVSPLHTADGGVSASPLVSATPMVGVLAAIGAAVLALLTGVVSARVVGSMRAGMIATGLVLVWVAFQSAQVDDLVRARRAAGPLWILAGEGVIVGILMVAVASLIVLLSGQKGGDDDLEHAPHLVTSRPEGARAADGALPLPLVPRLFGENILESLLVIGAGVLAGGAAAFLVAFSPLKGQTIAAAIVGGLAAAAIGRLVGPRAPLPLLVVPCALLAVLGPMVGAIFLGQGAAAVETIYRGGLLPFAHVAPLDWLAGAFLGVPLGVSWAASMVEKRSPQPA